VQKGERPAWTTASLPIKVKCVPSVELPFKVSDGFSDRNKYLLSQFALLGSPALKFDNVYLQSLFKQGGFSVVKLVENQVKGVQGIVALSEAVTVVAFRGTHSTAGVMTNMGFFTSGVSISSASAGLHNGFKSAFDSIQQDLRNAIGAEQRKKIPTFYVGHSLGGALAMIAATDGHTQGVNVQGVLTLGQPRIGNSMFASQFENILGEKYVRYVFGNDPIPHLPPAPAATALAAEALTNNGLFRWGVRAISLFRFAHVGPPIHLGNALFASTAEPSDESWDQRYWAMNAAALRNSLSGGGPQAESPTLQSAAMDNPIGDHEVEKYLCEILKRAEMK
jgi:pimeloyl-ACP methyl ester carboxylesterase